MAENTLQPLGELPEVSGFITGIAAKDKEGNVSEGQFGVQADHIIGMDALGVKPHPAAADELLFRDSAHKGRLVRVSWEWVAQHMTPLFALDVTISTEQWVIDPDPVNGYAFFCNVTDPTITAKLLPRITLSEGSLETAYAAGMCPVATAHNGYVRLKSVQKPTADISFTCALYSLGPTPTDELVNITSQCRITPQSSSPDKVTEHLWDGDPTTLWGQDTDFPGELTIALPMGAEPVEKVVLRFEQGHPNWGMTVTLLADGQQMDVAVIPSFDQTYVYTFPKPRTTSTLVVRLTDPTNQAGEATFWPALAEAEVWTAPPGGEPAIGPVNVPGATAEELKRVENKVDDLTPTDIGAAKQDHTHALESLGAAKAEHDHTTNEITDFPTEMDPTAHKSTHATGGADALTPKDIGAAAVVGPTTVTLTTSGWSGIGPWTQTATVSGVTAADKHLHVYPVSVADAAARKLYEKAYGCLDVQAESVAGGVKFTCRTAKPATNFQVVIEGVR